MTARALTEQEKRMCEELRRFSLRHPRVVNGAVLALCKKEELNFKQIERVTAEWRALGLHEQRKNA